MAETLLRFCSVVLVWLGGCAPGLQPHHSQEQTMSELFWAIVGLGVCLLLWQALSSGVRK